jgi:hypothetical protein
VTPHAILAMPPTATWTRSRHLHAGGPQPLRNSSWPWGLPNIGGANRDKLEAENADLRLALELIHLSLTRSPSTTWMLLAPEDRGRGAHGHPASIWQLKELRTWAFEHGAVRGALNQCELATSSTPRPLGFLKHAIEHGSLSTSAAVTRGWPTFSSSASRHYLGPLPRRCRCGQPHQHWRDAAFQRTANTNSGFAHIDVAIWFARQVLRPHLLPLSPCSAHLRKGRDKDLAGLDGGPAESLRNEDIPELTDSGSDATWPEPDLADITDKQYVDVQLADILGIQDHLHDADAIQDSYLKAPAAPSQHYSR